MKNSELVNVNEENKLENINYDFYNSSLAFGLVAFGIFYLGVEKIGESYLASKLYGYLK